MPFPLGRTRPSKLWTAVNIPPFSCFCQGFCPQNRKSKPWRFWTHFLQFSGSFLQQIIFWDGHLNGEGRAKGALYLLQTLCSRSAFQSTTKCSFLGWACGRMNPQPQFFSIFFGVSRVFSLARTSQLVLKDCLTLTSQWTAPPQWGDQELDRPTGKYLRLLQCHWSSVSACSLRFLIS